MACSRLKVMLCYHQQFHQYQQNDKKNSTLKLLNQKKIPPHMAFEINVLA